MKTIYKYELPLEPGFDQTVPVSVNLPSNAEVLTVAWHPVGQPYPSSRLYLWAKIDTQVQSLGAQTRRFLIVGTGRPLPEDKTTLKFLGTTFHGLEVFHVFEVF